MPNLAQSLTERLKASGWVVRVQGDLLSAEKEVISAKWLLGNRRVKHCATLRFDESAHVAALQETATETATGIPPPSFSMATRRQSGREVSEARFDQSIGGGGSLQYGELRKLVEQECQLAGWAFRLAIFKP